MISVVYVMAHTGGEATPGDDMQGSKVRWATLDEARALLLPAQCDFLDRLQALLAAHNADR